MNIVHEFLNGDTPSIGNTEDMINFFIDHYGDFLKIYRVMMAHNKLTKEKQKKAHVKLQELRNHVEKLQKQRHQFTDAEREEILQQTEYYEKLREEPDVVYFNGEPISSDYITDIIIKNQRFFKKIEEVDRKGRIKIAKYIGKSSKWILTPVKKMINSALDDNKGNATMYNYMEHTIDIIEKFPERVTKLMVDSIDVDLSKHRPNNIDECF
jgi:hypothetical protein